MTSLPYLALTYAKASYYMIPLRFSCIKEKHFYYNNYTGLRGVYGQFLHLIYILIDLIFKEHFSNNSYSALKM